jgi:predicted RNA binding protein with dsRBD fold (UPF0201 family)
MMDSDVHIHIKTKIFPTEDIKKVESAIKNIFSKADIRPMDDRVFAESTDIEGFVEFLAQERIRDTAREHIRKYRINDSAKFYLNKQAAYKGHLSFCGPLDESLGSIEVQIELTDWDGFYKSLSPPRLENKTESAPGIEEEPYE